MKKSALLLPALILSLAACGASTPDTKTVTLPETSASPAANVPAEVAAEVVDDEPEFSAVNSDFTIGVKVTEKKCFGSAGCLVSFRIDPKYVGDQELPDTGTVEVTYRVTGGEDGPQINTFTIESGSASYDSDESLSTSSSSAKIKAKVTDVSYDAPDN